MDYHPHRGEDQPAVGLSNQARWVLGVIAVAVIGLGCFLAAWQVLNPGHGVSGAGAGLGTAAVFTANLVAAKDPVKSISELSILKENPALLEPFQQINKARQTPPDEWEREIDAHQVPVYPGYVR